MKLYVIKDLESGLYVSRRTPYRLVEFGTDMQMFSTRAQAMRLVEETLGHDIEITHLQNDLAWDLLEKIYETDRWHINCTNQELQDCIDKFKDLKVVELCLEKVN